MIFVFLFLSRFAILFGMNFYNIYIWEGWVWGWCQKGSLPVVLTCCHRSYCTVSLFNKCVKSVCCASLDMINQLHAITKLSKLSCRWHVISSSNVFLLWIQHLLKPCLFPNGHWHYSINQNTAKALVLYVKD